MAIPNTKGNGKTENTARDKSQNIKITARSDTLGNMHAECATDKGNRIIKTVGLDMKANGNTENIVTGKNMMIKANFATKANGKARSFVVMENCIAVMANFYVKANGKTGSTRDKEQERRKYVPSSR